jgi:hypothetical protein
MVNLKKMRVQDPVLAIPKKPPTTVPDLAPAGQRRSNESDLATKIIRDMATEARRTWIPQRAESA